MVAFFIIAGLLIYFGYRIYKINQEIDKIKEEIEELNDPLNYLKTPSVITPMNTDLFESGEIPYYNGADSND